MRTSYFLGVEYRGVFLCVKEKMHHNIRCIAIGKLQMVFQSPERTFIVPSGARMDISEVFRRAVTSD